MLCGVLLWKGSEKNENSKSGKSAIHSDAIPVKEIPLRI